MTNKSLRLGVWSVLTIFPCFIATALWSMFLLSFVEALPYWMNLLVLLPAFISPGIGGFFCPLNRWLCRLNERG